ncbi:MAG: hypothetical protein ACJ8GW_03060 [Massilia sp.]
MRFVQQAGRVAALLAAAAVVSGCSMFGPSVPTLRMGDVRVLATADANQNSPVVFAVVLVSDPALEARLMSAETQWFTQSLDLAATYPTILQAYSCELTPGQEVRLSPALFKGRHAYAVLVFAKLSGGERRARIDQWREGGAISFTRDNWVVQANPKALPAPPPAHDIACSPGSGLRPV